MRRGRSRSSAAIRNPWGKDIGPGQLWTYLAFVGSATLIGWAVIRTSAVWPRRRRIGLVVVSLIAGFAMWKLAFTRVFPAYAFASLLVSLAVIGASLGDRRWWLTSLFAIGVAFVATAKLPPASYADIAGSARSLAIETINAVIPSRAQ